MNLIFIFLIFIFYFNYFITQRISKSKNSFSNIINPIQFNMIARLSKPLFVTSLALTFTPLVTCEDKDKNANKKSDKEEKKPKVSFDKFTENIGKGDFDELIKSQLNGPLYPLLKFYEEGVPRNVSFNFFYLFI